MLRKIIYGKPATEESLLAFQNVQKIVPVLHNNLFEIIIFFLILKRPQATKTAEVLSFLYITVIFNLFIAVTSASEEYKSYSLWHVQFFHRDPHEFVNLSLIIPHVLLNLLSTTKFSLAGLQFRVKS